MALRARKVSGALDKRATGLDKLSNRLIRECAELISPYIAISFNCCVATFPHEWKLAKVTPIFKQGDRSDMDKDFCDLSNSKIALSMVSFLKVAL